MNDLSAQPAEFQAVITITRAATGKVEEYLLTGTTVPEGEQNGSNAHNDIPQSGS